MISEENGEVLHQKNKEFLYTAKDLQTGITNYFSDRESAQIYALAACSPVSIRPPLYIMDN